MKDNWYEWWSDRVLKQFWGFRLKIYIYIVMEGSLVHPWIFLAIQLTDANGLRPIIVLTSSSNLVVEGQGNASIWLRQTQEGPSFIWWWSHRAKKYSWTGHIQQEPWKSLSFITTAMIRSSYQLSIHLQLKDYKWLLWGGVYKVIKQP